MDWLLAESLPPNTHELAKSNEFGAVVCRLFDKLDNTQRGSRLVEPGGLPLRCGDANDGHVVVDVLDAECWCLLKPSLRHELVLYTGIDVYRCLTPDSAQCNNWVGPLMTDLRQNDGEISHRRALSGWRVGDRC